MESHGILCMCVSWSPGFALEPGSLFCLGLVAHSQWMVDMKKIWILKDDESVCHVCLLVEHTLQHLFTRHD